MYYGSIMSIKMAQSQEERDPDERDPDVETHDASRITKNNSRSVQQICTARIDPRCTVNTSKWS